LGLILSSDPTKSQESHSRHPDDCEAEHESCGHIRAIPPYHQAADKTGGTTSHTERDQTYDPADKSELTEVEINLVECSANSLQGPVWSHVDYSVKWLLLASSV
jgi:hypothetical protein